MTTLRYSSLVLVIDDEPGITRLCERLLYKSGFRVKAFVNPREGLAYLENEQVDLLLVDIRMPELDGFGVIDLARRQQPDLAVVVMTGFGTVETAIEALRRGADGLVLKPFSGGELVQTVQRALQENHQKQDALRLQTLRPLFAITGSLFAETDPGRLKELLLDAVTGHLRCGHAGLYIRKQGADCFRLESSRGELPAEESLGEAGGIAAQAGEWGNPVNVRSDGPGGAHLQAYLTQYGLSSAMAAPLTSPMELKTGGAVLVAARSRGEAPFRESDLEMFAILARQAAAAHDNARLHAELRAYIRQVEESQRALIQAEKMSIAGRLTASIAHEINNPLQSVQNCLHLTGRKELESEQRQNYLDMAQSELERLMQTVQRMLEYYRPTALDRKPVDLNNLVQRVLMLLERQLSDHHVQVRTRLAAHLPHVLAVGDQIQQVLLNLVLNAMEAMPEGGRITIETRTRKAGIEIVVEDSGPGVPPGKREHIFEPFVSTKEGGTGLGLAVSYGIIAAHGGSLDLVEGRGRGACFRIILSVGETT